MSSVSEGTWTAFKVQQPLHQLFVDPLMHLTTEGLVDCQHVDKCLLALHADAASDNFGFRLIYPSVVQRQDNDLTGVKGRQQLLETVPYIMLSLIVCGVDGACQSIKAIPRHCLWEHGQMH